MSGSVLWVGGQGFGVWFIGGHSGGWAGWCCGLVGGHSGIENFQLRLKGLSLQKKEGMIKEGV